MPLFEYKCTNCGKITEFILKSGEAPNEGCKHCGEKRLERIMFSSFAVGGASSGTSCDVPRELCGHTCSGHCKH